MLTHPKVIPSQERMGAHYLNAAMQNTALSHSPFLVPIFSLLTILGCTGSESALETGEGVATINQHASHESTKRGVASSDVKHSETDKAALIPPTFNSLGLFPVASRDFDLGVIDAFSKQASSSADNPMANDAAWIAVADAVVPMLDEMRQDELTVRDVDGKREILVIMGEVGVSGNEISRVTSDYSVDLGMTNSVLLSGNAVRKVMDLTAKRLGKHIAVVVDGQVVAILPILSPIVRQFVVSTKGIDKVRPSVANLSE